ncbi:MAG: hypothetical protein J5818_03345 [Eggerthellaceae bacterium]|nr:hypothetical protein [Eggerthellaceae bacterium]
MDIESFIKDLDPELQEKARSCGNLEELLALAKEEKVPVPDEALAAVAGGDDVDVGSCDSYKCPKCGHKVKSYGHEDLNNGYTRYYFNCSNCGYKWHNDVPNYY